MSNSTSLELIDKQIGILNQLLSSTYTVSERLEIEKQKEILIERRKEMNSQLSHAEFLGNYFSLSTNHYSLGLFSTAATIIAAKPATAVIEPQLNNDNQLLTSKSINEKEDKREFDFQKKEWNIFYNNLQKTEKDLSKYLSDIKIFNIISVTLAAAAWAITATYTASAFFTFGATIPSAIASGIQAGIMTYFVNESFNTQYDIQKNLEQIQKIKNNKEMDFINKIVQLDYKTFLSEMNKTRNNFSKFGAAEFYTFIDLATKTSAIRLVVSMGFKTLTAKLINQVASRTTLKLAENFLLIEGIKGFKKND